MTNEALLGQSERLQERMKRLEEEGSINSRIIQVSYDKDDEVDGHWSYRSFEELLIMMMVVVIIQVINGLSVMMMAIMMQAR